MARLTIILTLRNIRTDYVSECLESIRQQTFKDWKVIAVDDFSNIEYDFLENYPEVTYVRNAKHLGLCKTLNKAFTLTTTEYVIRLGSDDVFKPDLLEREVVFLDQHPEFIACCCCQLQKFGYSTTLIKRPDRWSLEGHDSTQSWHGYGYAGGLMFRGAALKHCSINENYPVCEDFDFHLQLLRLGKIYSIQEPLYLYRAHGSNLCRRFNPAQRTKILNQILKCHCLTSYTQ